MTIVPPPPPYHRTYHLQFGINVGLGKHPPCPVDEALDDEHQVGPLQVVFAPGHSPGHLAFYWPETRVLIAGDAVTTWPKLDAGWPAFNLNKEKHASSLRKMADLKPEVVGVGHGEPITRGGADTVEELAEKEAQAGK